MNWLMLVFLLSVLHIEASAQSSTDLYLVDVQHGIIVVPVDGPLNLTNRDGYDNQPHFSPDGRYLMYTSQRGNQSDIYRIRFTDLLMEQLTNTLESEYSPTPLPNGSGFSVIRVEADGTQRLWKFDSEGKNPTLLFENIKPVGYHAWIDDERIAMFILGDPPTLHIASLKDGSVSIATESIGRSLHRVPGSMMLSFVHKLDDSEWRIRRLEPASGTIQDIAPTLPDREDHAWTPDGDLIMAGGATLYLWNQEQNQWTPWYDFSSHGITNITRLAVSPKGDKVVMVADR